MTDQEREAQNKEDRKWLDKFESDWRKLKDNRENVPLQQLTTKYARAYNTLLAEIECDADWWAKRYLEVLAFPRHPKDTAENERLDKHIAAILQEERRSGGRVERYKAALIRDLDRKAYEQLVWEIYDRMEREAFYPYWQRHCHRLENGVIYNDIFNKLWWPEEGCWINSDYKTGRDFRYPPQSVSG